MDPFRKVKGSPFAGSALHPRGQFSMHPLSRETTVGFRLAKDGIDEYRFRWGRSFTVPPDHASQGITLEDYPAFRNQRIGIRLCVGWEEKT